ncbi:MAG: hypothetical protein R3B69_01565 [Candidatus Paceibacterota bacterium]
MNTYWRHSLPPTLRFADLDIKHLFKGKALTRRYVVFLSFGGVDVQEGFF